jgi:hypothetical protein
MRLIGLAVVLALGLALAPLATDAPQIYRIGSLSKGAHPFSKLLADALTELGSCTLAS